MAKLTAARTAQCPQVMEFVFNFNDTMADIAGVTKTFGSVYTDAGVFDIINMPQGAVITGGELIVETQGVGPTAYTISLGTSDSATSILGATSLLAAANTRTALLLTSALACNTGKNVRATIASTVANATAGKFRVRIMYTIDGRAETVVPG